MNALFAYFSSAGVLPEALLDRIAEAAGSIRLPRKGVLLREGTVCRNFYVVETGLLRCYEHRDGRQITTRFLKEDEVCVGIDSFFSQQNGREQIEAVEASVLSFIAAEDLQQIYRDFPSMHAVGRIAMEKMLAALSRRVMALCILRAREKYEWFTLHYPDMEARLPAKYIASWLGMTEVTLSALKSRRLHDKRGGYPPLLPVAPWQTDGTASVFPLYEIGGQFFQGIFSFSQYRDIVQMLVG